MSAPPSGLVIALGYWAGDEAPAMRLARLLADIEPRRRADVTLAFCRRFDTPASPLLHETALHCGFKFGVMKLRSEREGAGHPHGCNELFAGTMEQFADAWAGGGLGAHSVLAIEADGCPLRADWLDVLLREHALTLAAGKRVTGHLMTLTDYPHINGTLAAHLSLWHDRPSLRHTPPQQAWDMHHAAVLTAEARPTALIRNFYGSRDWTPGALAAVAKETAWLASVKDDSAISWAERTLVARAAAPEGDLTMGTREDLLERVSAARRRHAEAGRELDEANQALHEHEAAARADHAEDGAGDEVLHPRLPRVTVRG